MIYYEFNNREDFLNFIQNAIIQINLSKGSWIKDIDHCATITTIRIYRQDVLLDKIIIDGMYRTMYCHFNGNKKCIHSDGDTHLFPVFIGNIDKQFNYLIDDNFIFKIFIKKVSLKELVFDTTDASMKMKVIRKSNKTITI